MADASHSSTEDPARNAARRWFSAPGLPFYEAFARQFLDRPRRLFLEVALARCPRRPIRILDVGCGTGSGLAYLRDRLPGASLAGCDPEPAMIERARATLGDDAELWACGVEDLPADGEPYDLVVSYSNLRLWPSLAAGLARVRSLLGNDGMAYLLDLDAAMPADVRASILAAMPDDTHRCFLESQLAAARELADVLRQAESLGGLDCQGASGGLGGLPMVSPEAYRLIERNPELANALFDMANGGFGSPVAAQAVFHLFLRRSQQ